MHASLRQLLSLRDGEPVDTRCEQHVASCDYCQRELVQLKGVRRALRRLPNDPAPESAWAEIRARLDADAARAGHHDHNTAATPARRGRHAQEASHQLQRTRLGFREGAFASAAAVLALVCLRAWTVQLEHIDAAATAAISAGFAQMPRLALSEPGLEQLLSRVRAQEAALEQIAPDDGQRLSSSARRQALKNRIAFIDHYCLTEKNLTPEDRYALMAERSRLVDKLLGEFDVRGVASSQGLH